MVISDDEIVKIFKEYCDEIDPNLNIIDNERHMLKTRKTLKTLKKTTIPFFHQQLLWNFEKMIFPFQTCLNT